MSKIDKLIEKFYSLFRKETEWQYLKSLLDELNFCISENRNFKSQTYLDLGKLVFYSLSPNLSHLHPLIYSIIENIISHDMRAGTFTYIGFSIFAHCKKVEKGNVERFNETLQKVFARFSQNQVFCAGLFVALLSNPEGSKDFLEVIQVVMARHPNICEELLWICGIHMKSSSKELFKLIKNLKATRSDKGVVLKSFLSALENDPHSKYASTDAVIEVFSRNTASKTFVLSLLLERIQDKRILMRMSKFVQDETEEDLASLMSDACNFLISRNKKFDLVIIEKLQEPENDIHCINAQFYTSIINNLLVNLGRFSGEDLSMIEGFKQVFAFDRYRTMWEIITGRIDSGLDSKDSDFYLKSLVLLKKNLEISKVTQETILNILVDHINVERLSTWYFFACSEYMGKKYPENISSFLEVCHQVIGNFDMDLIKSFGEFYLKISQVNKGIRIKSIPYDQKKLSFSLIQLLKFCTLSLGIALSYDTFQVLWDNYCGEFNEDIKVIFLHSGNKQWAKVTVKKLRTLKGILLVYNFFYESLNFHLENIRKTKVVKYFYSALFQRIDGDYSLQPCLYQLWILLTSEVTVFYEPIFKQLIKEKNESVVEVFKILVFSITKKTAEALSSQLIDKDLDDKIESLNWAKTKCKTQSDLLVLICFHYVFKYKDQKDKSVSAFYLLQHFARYANPQQAIKILELSHEYFSDNSKGVLGKIFVLKSLHCLNIKNIIEEKKDFLMNSYLNSLSGLLKNQLNNKSRKSEKLLLSLIDFYFSIFPYYIQGNLFDLIPSELIKSLFLCIVNYPENDKFFMFLEIVRTGGVNLNEEWIVNLLILDSPNLFDALVVSENSKSSILPEVIFKVSSFISSNPFLPKSIIKLWSSYWISNSESIELSNIFKYLLIFNISFERILQGILSIVNESPNDKVQKIYLEFLYKFSSVYETELILSNACLSSVESLYRKVKLSQCFIPITSFIYKILKNKMNSDEILFKLIRLLSGFYKPFFSSFFEKCLKKEFSDPLIMRQEFESISKWTQQLGQNFFCLVFPDQQERNMLMKNWLKSLCRFSVDNCFPTGQAFMIFFNWCKDRALYSFLYPTLLEISQKNNIFQLLKKNPSACFRWLEVLNENLNHLNLFTEFRSKFQFSSYSMQDTSNLLFLTSLLIYTGDTEDYFHPIILSQIHQELSKIINIDSHFPNACLLLLVLSIRFSVENYFDFLNRYWPTILIYHQRKPNQNIFCSLLKLFDVLILLDYPGLSLIYSYTQSRKSFSENPKNLLLKIPQNFNEKSLNQQEELLIAHYNTIYNTQPPVDLQKISILIEEEFCRIKEAL